MKNLKHVLVIIAFLSACPLFAVAQTGVPVVTAKVSAPRVYYTAAYDRYRKLAKPYATVRANRKGFFVGTLFKGDEFKLRDTRGGWASGQAPGFGKSSVWVQQDRLDKRRLAPYKGLPTPILTKDKSRQLLLARYASLINPKRDDGSKATLEKRARLYLNIDFQGRRARDPHPFVLQPDPNRRILWRWITDDRRFAAVRTFRVNEENKRITQSRWGFIRCTSISAKVNGKSLPCQR